MSDANPFNVGSIFSEIDQLNEKLREQCRKTKAVMFSDITASTSFFDTHGDVEGVYLVHKYNQAMTPVIGKHGGEVVKSLGDGLLITFDMPESACAAAIEMQQNTSQVSAALGTPQAISITIGIHYGDVFYYDGDVFGDAVNLAARVSSLASPGSVLITRDVRDQIDDDAFLVSFATKAMLKGKPAPVTLYHVHWDPSEIEKTTARHKDCHLRAFVSSITPHTAQQIRFLEGFSKRLFSIGIEPVFLKQTYYDRRDPIGTTRKQIEPCDFVIVLGLERSHAYYLKDKEFSDDEAEALHRRYTSGWLHLEAGLANALGKEVFVLCNQEICGDGIFDREFNSYPVYEIKDQNPYAEGLEEFWDTLSEWVSERSSSAKHDS